MVVDYLNGPRLISCPRDLGICICKQDGDPHFFCEAAAALTRNILCPVKNVNDPSSPKYQSV